MEQTIKDILREAGVAYVIEDHEPVYTVAESMAHMGDKTPVKNLLLAEEKGDRIVFIIMHGLKRLDAKYIATELGTKKLQFAKPDILMRTLGVAPGSASLFNLLHSGSESVEIVVDAELLRAKKVGFHPGSNAKTYVLSGSDITIFLRAVHREATYLELH